MSQTTLAVKPGYVVAVAVACVLYVSAVAVYFNRREARLRAEAALTAQPPIRQVVGIWEDRIEVTLAFDDGSKRSGTATAKSLNDPHSLPYGSGEALAMVLKDETGVVWMPVYGSGKDRKREWASTEVSENGEQIHRVRFKVFPQQQARGR